jgi:glycosyltransferase involved in cell wall biosynthesis
MPEAPDDVVLVLPEPAGRRAREVAVPLAAALGARVVADEADADGVGTAVAVGWRAVAAVLRAHDCGTRALLAVDHEPDLVAPASSEARWAVDAYRRGLPAVAAGPWLAQTLRERHGADATPFMPGIDHTVFAPRPVVRREDLVLLVARPRQALPLAVLAVARLLRRRPELEVAVIGEARPLDLPFRHRHVGAVPAAERAEVFNSATVALVPSLSVPPAVAGELMACAAPLVLPDTPAASDLGPAPLLAPHDPGEVADAIERLVDDPEDRSDRVRAGLAAAAGWTWEQAAADVSAALGGAR